jgi:NitT/TauT family transport system ATP-binding protein
LPWRSVLENVMLQVEIRRLDRDRFRKRALKLLESTDLGGFESSYPHDFPEACDNASLWFEP